MTGNFTTQHGLIEDLSSTNWLANPAGKQGYEVIVLERIGDGGNRFYHSLKPGETLRLGERLFGKFTVLAIDMRQARFFPIEGQFAARERGRHVKIRATIYYQVANARRVAMETVDPLGALRDKVIATLNRELARYPEADINPGLIEKVISSLGPVTQLGLTVEGADIIEFSADTRLTDQTIQAENLQAQLNADAIRQEADLQRKRHTYQAIDKSDINILLHEHPEMVDKVFTTFAGRDQYLLQERIEAAKPAINAYITQQAEDGLPPDPDHIIRIIDSAAATSGTRQTNLLADKITWGDDAQSSSDEPSIAFGDDSPPAKKNKPKTPPEDDARIQFGS